MLKFFLRIVPIIAFLILQEKSFASEAPNDTLELSFPTAFASKCGENIAVPIKVKNFANIKSLTFSVKINGTLVSFTSIGASNIAPAPQANTQGSDFVAFTWSSNTAQTKADGTTIFEAVFKPIKGGGQTTPLEFKTLPTNIQALNGANQNVPIKVKNGSLQIVDDIAPAPTCPLSAVYYVPNSLDTVITSLGASVLDNCGSGSISSFTLSGASTGSGFGDATQMAFKQGTTNVVYTAKDDAGNAAQCAFQVVVKKDKNVTIFANTTTANCSDSIVKIDIFATNVKNLGSFQFKTDWDTSGFIFKRVENVAAVLNYIPNPGQGNTGFNFTEINIGKLEMVSPLLTTSVTLPDNIRLFTLVLTVKGKGGNYPFGFENIDISDNSTSTQPVPADLIASVLKVEDKISPTLTCPFDVTLPSTSGGTGLVQVTGIDPAAGDNCALKEVTYTSLGATTLSGLNSANGKLFAPGTTTVIYNAQDFGGNVKTCSFNVKITRLALLLQNDTISCNDTKVKVKVRVRDFKDVGKLQYSINFNPTKLKYVSGSATIPNAAISAVTGIVSIGASTGKIITSFDNPTGFALADNDVLFELTFDVLDQTINNIYDITISDKVAELRNPTASTFLENKDEKLYILDKIAPVITGCPTATITILTSACDTTVTWLPITATDNCSIPTGTFTKLSGDVFPVGKTSVIYTFTDNNANKSICTFDVFVKDKILPTITSCPTDTILVPLNTNACNGSVPAITPGFTDNCPGGIATQSPAAGTVLGLGVHKVTITVTDKGNNTATCVRYIKIADITAPNFVTFPTPAFILQPSDPGFCGAKVNWVKPTVSDNCDAAPIVLQGKFPLDFFSIGKDSVQFIALDNAGNTNIAFLKIRVYDAEPPKFIDCPKGFIDTTLYATVDCDAIFKAPTLHAKDNCINGIFDVFPKDAPANNVYKLGKTIFEYVAQDKDLPNKTVCAFIVTVKDTIRPTITCAKDTILSTGNTCSAIYTIPNAKVADNCTPASKIILTNDYSLNIFNAGTKTVTYTAIDSSGNENKCKVNITVKDLVKPTFANMPPSVTVNVLGFCSRVVTWIEPDANDNCKIDVVTSSPKSGDIFSLGTTLVKYFAKDKSGNMAVDSFSVTVVDDQKPQPKTPCPSGFKDVFVDAGKCGATFKFPDFTDNCTPSTDLDITINGLKPTSDFYAYPGTYSLSLKVKDASGNENTCGAVITIKDNIAPVVSNCPKDISVSALNGACDYTFSAANPLPVPSFKDECDGVVITPTVSGIPTNGKFPAGETTIFYTAKDNAGNSAICSFKVVVAGNASPILNPADCKDIALNLTITTAKCDTSLLLPTPTVIYLCTNKASEIFTDIMSNTPFAAGQNYTFKTGTTSLLFTAKNQAGLTSTCIFKVTVNEKTPPNFANFPADQTINVTGTNCKAAANWAFPTATDKCSNPDSVKIKLISPVGAKSGDEFPTGPNVIIYKATDLAGNMSTRSFTINVIDTQAPKFDACPTNSIILEISGTKIKDNDNQVVAMSTNKTCDSLVVLFKPLTATDNCDAFVLSTLTKSIFPIGASIVSWAASDKSGNLEFCTVNLTISPLKAAKASIGNTMACIGETVQLSAETITNAAYNWTGPNLFASKLQNPMVKSINSFNEGKYAVNYEIGACKSKFDTVSLKVLNTPLVKADSFIVEVGGTLNKNITTNDVDLIKGETFKVKLTQTLSNATAGVLNLNPDGTFTFASKAPYTGEVVFKYDLCYDNCPDACIKDQSVKIIITPKINNDVTIPTLFTPNGDGINDVLIINGLVGKTGATLAVFNQWGEEVYRSADYKNDWEGTWKSKNLPDGTYYYIFQLNAATEVKKGFVNIFR
jgi:gliding motility-associated-like protein